MAFVRRYGLWIIGWRHAKFRSLYGVLSDNRLFFVWYVSSHIGGHVVGDQSDDIEGRANVFAWQCVAHLKWHKCIDANGSGRIGRRVQFYTEPSGYSDSVHVRRSSSKLPVELGFVEIEKIYKDSFTAFIQILMYFFRLGSLSSLLSDPLVNGFTTGAAVHVTVSQLKDLFGVKIPRHKGAFKIIYVSFVRPSINSGFNHSRFSFIFISRTDGRRLHSTDPEFKCENGNDIVDGDTVHDLYERSDEAALFKTVSVPHTGRIDGCRWWHSHLTYFPTR